MKLSRIGLVGGAMLVAMAFAFRCTPSTLKDSAPTTSSTASSSNPEPATASKDDAAQTGPEIAPGDSVALVACEVTTPADLKPGVRVSGSEGGEGFDWSCAPEELESLSQPIGSDGADVSYHLVCEPEGGGRRLSLFVQGPRPGTPYTTTMPYASTVPNVSFAVDTNGGLLQQDSFVTDVERIRSLAAITWDLDQTALVGDSPAHRVRGCVEAEFNAVAGQSPAPAASLVMRFDATIPYSGANPASAAGETLAPTANLVACPAILPEDLAEGVTVSGELEGQEFGWTCARDSAHGLHQPVGDDGALDSYQLTCQDAQPTRRVSVFVQGAAVGQTFTAQMPYASSYPNVSFQVVVDGKRLEQDSFRINAARVENVAGIVWALDGASTSGAKAAKRVRGCVEGTFRGVAGPAGQARIMFDQEIELVGR